MLIRNQSSGRVVEELVNLTGQLAIPVVRKGDNFVIGFDEEKIKELISIAAKNCKKQYKICFSQGGVF